jgi:hypothetical protein
VCRSPPLPYRPLYLTLAPRQKRGSRSAAPR